MDHPTHLASFAVTSTKRAFLEKLFESEIFNMMNIGRALYSITQGKLETCFDRKHGSMTPLTITSLLPLLRILWEVEEQWYTDGNPRPFQDENGLRYMAEINIWEPTTFPDHIQKPKTVEGTELVPWKMSLVGIGSVEWQPHRYDYAKGSDTISYRGVKLFLSPFGLHDKRTAILDFLQDSKRISAVIKYFEQYYG